MNKAYCVYHSRDLDGYTSGAIVKMAMEEGNTECVLIGYDYGQPFPYEKIEAGRPVVMVDVSLPMAEMVKLAEHTGGMFTWIDHHISAITEFNEMVVPDKDSNFYIQAVLDNTISACEAVWRFFFPHRALPIAIELLGKYDTWREHDTEYWKTDILPFQYGMRQICSSPETFPQAIINDSFFVRDVKSDGVTILKYQKQIDAIAARSAFEIDFMGYKAICINGGGFNSQAFESVYDESKHDLMMPFKYDGVKWIFSLYTTKEIDCSKLAKEMGGGGHKKAAGFQSPNIPEFIFKNYFINK